MRKNRGNLLYLTGGLGNQLFQLCFGLRSTKNQLILETMKGKPRTSIRHIPDLLEFRLPERVSSGNFKNSLFVSRVINYNLRICIVPKGLEKSVFFVRLVNFLSRLVVILHYKRRLKLHVAHGVGFDRMSNVNHEDSLLVGYFQSYRWLESQRVVSELDSLYLVSPSDHFKSLLEKMKEFPTIVLHIRLGDYLNEVNFGITSPEYLNKSLDEIYSRTGEVRIWGFSDEPEKAIEIAKSAGISISEWVSPELLTSAETLQLMREGSGFILANSTFSWWAASLRRDKSAPVVAPEPWFKNMDEPRDLVPNEWIRIKAF
jgi:hypothetical protein